MIRTRNRASAAKRPSARATVPCIANGEKVIPLREFQRPTGAGSPIRAIARVWLAAPPPCAPRGLHRWSPNS
jgi:hypothetical protein